MSMKRRIPLLFMTLAMSAATAFSADYATGMRLYNSGSYIPAKNEFKQVLDKNPQDLNARYMYCQTLVKTRDFETAITEYKTIILLSPNSRVGELSKQGLKLVEDYLANQKTVLSGSAAKPDYIENAYRNGMKYTWKTQNVKLYIEPGLYKSLTAAAFREWAQSSGGAISFSGVPDPDDAQIKVYFPKFVGYPDDATQENGNCSCSYANGTISDCTVEIYSSDENGGRIPAEKLYHTMLHQAGHALGIAGHSVNPADVMSRNSKTPKKALSTRDKKTLVKLYNRFSSAPSSEAVAAAGQEEVSSVLQTAPERASSWIEAGDYEADNGNYDKAVAHYRKALTIEDSALIYKKMADVYKKTGDIDSEIVCAKTILRKEPDNYTVLENLLENLLEQSRYADARRILDDFVDKNPGSTNDATVKAYRKVLSDKKVKYAEFQSSFMKGLK